MKRWMALCLLACACGSSDNNGTPDAGFPTGTGTITGTVNGQQLVVRDAVFCPNAKINPNCGGISLLARPGNSE